MQVGSRPFVQAVDQAAHLECGPRRRPSITSDRCTQIDEEPKFKTPTLREIARTAPYMHDGSIATLEDVLEFYDRGGNANPCRDTELRRLSLTAEEKGALLAFLQSLSGQIREGLE